MTTLWSLCDVRAVNMIKPAMFNQAIPQRFVISQKTFHTCKKIFRCYNALPGLARLDITTFVKYAKTITRT
eukprot:TRINITY_DN6075_c0_g1_i1.p1 TRINITY_DN6075_c0_g1~~TRINITY_DN6075_c0_g1_i1.p1  ORF type:complete len:71 (+),score=7.61 TRINITY_DN6075_c0_g1_i1:214-426(+)